VNLYSPRLSKKVQLRAPSCAIRLNRNVSSDLLKLLMNKSCDRRCSGRLFQADGAREVNISYNTVWNELCECIRANLLQKVL